MVINHLQSPADHKAPAQKRYITQIFAGSIHYTYHPEPWYVLWGRKQIFKQKRRKKIRRPSEKVYISISWKRKRKYAPFSPDNQSSLYQSGIEDTYLNIVEHKNDKKFIITNTDGGTTRMQGGGGSRNMASRCSWQLASGGGFFFFTTLNNSLLGSTVVVGPLLGNIPMPTWSHPGRDRK